MVREAKLNDALAIARVHVDTWRTTYCGIVPDDYLTSLSYKKRENSWVQILSTTQESNLFTYVTEDEVGQIVGFAAGGPERTKDSVYKGELYALYILKTYQRQGIGHRLTQTLVRRLYESGFHSMLVWVLADNPACGFYQALGGQKVYEKQDEIGGRILNEIAYGWTDTLALITGHNH
ncbi:MAG: GNAT family N-acetyltransferase [Scytonema sp. RU_4_4]|nr:GNAT family N-acetyltransferase [Scytonema sp. RU_4_4]NJR73630.1 GNAT family N-acetyltransferase [Scytonema sp. CRU_2_7]